jgi:hypothetical protein
MDMRKTYKQVAEKNNMSVEEVERVMQAALDAAYATPGFQVEYGGRAGEKPTLEEFLVHMAGRVAGGS